MGGFETTAHTLAFTLFCIATHPHVEDKILAELQSLGLVGGSAEKGESLCP